MKASVILPVFNACDRVERAIRSVTDTPPDFAYEILAVDDGSTDSTPAVLERLAAEIPALRVIRQENAGPAAARDRGVAEATGDYLLFCDSDDVFSPGAVQTAVNAAERHEAALLIFGYTLVQGDGRFPYHAPETDLTAPEGWKRNLSALYAANLLSQVWGKVFARSLITENALSFPRTMWGEDRLFLFSVLEKAPRAWVIPDCLYDYVQTKGSLISRFVPEKAEICAGIHRGILGLARDFGADAPEDGAIFSYMYCKSLISSFVSLFDGSCPLSHREKRAYIRAALAQPELRRVSRFPDQAGLSFRILARVLLSRLVTPNLIAAWGVHFAAGRMPGTFRKAKHAYNKGE